MSRLFSGTLLDEKPIITPNAVTIYTYRITNVTIGSDYTDSERLAVAIGEPGLSINISQTVSVSNSYNGDLGVVTPSKISAAVGFDVTKTNAIQITGNAEVPEYNNGRSVKDMTLSAYPVFKTKNFIIQQHKSVGGVNYGWSDYGSGYGREAYGISFTKTYSYK